MTPHFDARMGWFCYDGAARTAIATPFSTPLEAVSYALDRLTANDSAHACVIDARAALAFALHHNIPEFSAGSVVARHATTASASTGER